MRLFYPVRVFSPRPSTTFSTKHAPRFFKKFRLILIIFTGFYLLLSLVGCLVTFIVWERDLGPDTPATYGMTYQVVSFSPVGDNLTLRGWFMPAQSNKAIIMVHGRASNRADQQVYTLHYAADLHKAGYNVLTFDLRGHGQSDGWLISFGQYELRDVLGAWAYLKQRGFAPQNMGIWGWSMGASTTLLAMDNPDGQDIRVAVLDSGYADLKSELESTLSGFPGLLVPGLEMAGQGVLGVKVKDVRPQEALHDLHNRQLFLIHSANDTQVPPWNLAVLAKAGGSNIAETWLVPGAGHALAYRSRPAEYAARTIAFFNREFGLS
jgi:fermentation-respiration switch protein FrsA (DUF1100 family)